MSSVPDSIAWMHADSAKGDSPALAMPALGATSGDALTPGQRRAAVGAIFLAHVAGVWGLLQVDAVREAVHDTVPMFVDLIAPPAPPAPPAPATPPVRPPTPQRPLPVVRRAPPPLVAAAPSPAPSAFEVAAPAPAPPAPAPPAPPAPSIINEQAPPPAPAPAPAPKVIPASAVQYLVEPVPDYPRLSAKAGESGRVVIVVYIDEAGVPSQVRIGRSSGFSRLDASAIAAVQRARFKPPTLNGQPVSGWANVPIDFGLEK